MESGSCRSRCALKLCHNDPGDGVQEILIVKVLCQDDSVFDQREISFERQGEEVVQESDCAGGIVPGFCFGFPGISGEARNATLVGGFEPGFAVVFEFRQSFINRPDPFLLIGEGPVAGFEEKNFFVIKLFDGPRKSGGFFEELGELGGRKCPFLCVPFPGGVTELGERTEGEDFG